MYIRFVQNFFLNIDTRQNGTFFVLFLEGVTKRKKLLIINCLFFRKPDFKEFSIIKPRNPDETRKTQVPVEKFRTGASGVSNFQMFPVKPNAFLHYIIPDNIALFDYGYFVTFCV